MRGFHSKKFIAQESTLERILHVGRVACVNERIHGADLLQVDLAPAPIASTWILRRVLCGKTRALSLTWQQTKIHSNKFKIRRKMRRRRYLRYPDEDPWLRRPDVQWWMRRHYLATQPSSWSVTVHFPPQAYRLKSVVLSWTRLWFYNSAIAHRYIKIGREVHKSCFSYQRRYNLFLGKLVFEIDGFKPCS